MAKIDANGAHEIARVDGKAPSGNLYIFVMCSDGRILSKMRGQGYGSTFKVAAKLNDKKKWTKSGLKDFVAGRKLTVIDRDAAVP